uniref:TGF_BETA_2 domain-containing protein n=1 Tax=Parastrongyloides trichosuri TaxID=131310 RepID=A0A0N4ZS78_PARTI
MHKFLPIILLLHLQQSLSFRVFLLNEERKISLPIDVKNETKDEIEKNLLAVLGINTIPDDILNSDNFSKKYMEYIFKNEQDMLYDISSPDEVISFQPQEIISNNKKSIFLFDDYNLFKYSNTFVTAELRIIFNEEIKELGWLSANIKKNDEDILIDTVDRPQLKNTYIFNITSIVFQWLKSTDSDKIIFFDYNGKNLEKYGNYKVICMASLLYTTNERQSTFIKEERSIHRFKRSIIDKELSENFDTTFSFKTHNPFRNYPRCQLHKLFIEFKDLGWDRWVIAPRGYEASYCDGSCTFPLNSNMNTTNHAIITTLLHIIDPTRTEPAKCAPTKLKPMKILFIDDNSNVVIKRYQAMMVMECGCH